MHFLRDYLCILEGINVDFKKGLKVLTLRHILSGAFEFQKIHCHYLAIWIILLPSKITKKRLLVSITNLFHANIIRLHICKYNEKKVIAYHSKLFEDTIEKEEC